VQARIIKSSPSAAPKT